MTDIRRLMPVVLSAALWVHVLSVPGWSQSEGGFAVGLRGGAVIGNTELTDKPHGRAEVMLRRRLSGVLLGEFAGGCGRLDGTQYATDMAMGEMRILVSPERQGAFRPVGYVGFGAIRYNIADIPPQRTDDVEPLGTALSLPAGLGFQYVLSASSALEVLGGYTYTMRDDLNGANYKKGNDVIWGVTVGVTIGVFGDRNKRPTPPPVVQAAPVVEPQLPEVAPIEAEPIESVEPAPVEMAVEVAPVTVAEEALTAPPAAPAVVIAESAPATDSAGLVKFAPVFFARRRADLNPNAISLLAEIARVAALEETILLQVQGFGDRGTRGRHLHLARRRAAAVKAGLVDQGIDAWRIKIDKRDELNEDRAWRGGRVEVRHDPR